jgi:hypothetical protein
MGTNVNFVEASSKDPKQPKLLINLENVSYIEIDQESPSARCRIVFSGGHSHTLQGQQAETWLQAVSKQKESAAYGH